MHMNSKTFAGFSKTPIQIIIAVAFVITIVLAGPRGSVDAQLLVRFPDHERVFQGEVIEDMVVLDALNASIRAGNLPLKATVDEVRDITIIKRLDGQQGDVIFYMNTLIDAKKIHHIPVRAHDVVTVKIL